jgi:hypothetical protein
VQELGSGAKVMLSFHSSSRNVSNATPMKRESDVKRDNEGFSVIGNVPRLCSSPKCTNCGNVSQIKELIPSTIDNATYFCEECFPWSESGDKEDAISSVVSALETLAKNDDIYMMETAIKKHLMVCHPEKCLSLPIASLWIKEAAKADKVCTLKKLTNSEYVCLPLHLQDATSSAMASKIWLDTSPEEKFIEDTL